MSDSILTISGNEFYFKSESDQVIKVNSNSQGITFTSNLGKSFLPKKLIHRISIKSEVILINVSANNSWNENMKRKYPVRYRLGLIRPYKAYTKEIGTFRRNELESIKSKFEDLGFNCRSSDCPVQAST